MSCCYVGACLQVPATGATAAADPELLQQQADLAAKQQQLAAQHQALAAQLAELAAAAAGQAAGLDQLRAAVGGKADAAAVEGLAASVAGAAPAAELAGMWEGLREGLKGKADKGEVDALLGLLQVRRGGCLVAKGVGEGVEACEHAFVGHSVCSSNSMRRPMSPNSDQHNKWAGAAASVYTTAKHCFSRARPPWCCCTATWHGNLFTPKAVLGKDARALTQRPALLPVLCREVPAWGRPLLPQALTAPARPAPPQRLQLLRVCWMQQGVWTQAAWWRRWRVRQQGWRGCAWGWPC